MTNAAKAAPKLPQWLTEAIDQAGSTTAMFDKRHDFRPAAYWPARLLPDASPDAKPLSIKIANLASDGIGLIVPKPVSPGQDCTLTPAGTTDAGDPFESIRIRVVHCTQATQGYMVGCVILPNA